MRWTWAAAAAVVGAGLALGQPPTLTKKHTIGKDDLGRVTHVAFGGDSKTLVAASAFGTASYDLATGAGRKNYDAMKHTTGAVATLPPDRLVRGWFDFIEIGGPEDKIFPKTRFKCGGEVAGVTAGAGGKLVAGVIWKTKSVEVWDVAAGKRMATLAGSTGVPSGAVFSPDGTLIAVVDTTHTVTVWDVKAGKKAATLAGGPGRKEANPGPVVGFSPDGKTVYGPGEGGAKLVAWDLASKAKRWEALNPKKFRDAVQYEFNAVAVHPDGKHLVAATSANDAQWWIFIDATDGKVTGEFKASTRVGDGAPRFSPDGKWVAAGSFNGVVEVYEVR